MASFELFPKLPAHIRLDVWRHVASFPRIVGIEEGCLEGGWIGEDDLSMLSTTRSPAMLGVCCEAREIGLTIYKRVDLGIRTRKLGHDIPIYVNPEFDIIHRGKDSCSVGDAFQIRCKNLVESSEPLGMTRTLAVDSCTLDRQKPFHGLSPDLLCRMESVGMNAFRDTIAVDRKQKALADIALCSARGLREIIIVSGNDDDLSEVTLVPLVDPSQRSSRETAVATDAEELSDRLANYWKTKAISTALPTVNVMTVKRKPLQKFTLFPQLPIELQLAIWEFAVRQQSRVITMIHDPDLLVKPTLNLYRAPAISSACRAARHVMWKGHPPSKAEIPYVWCDPELDTVLLLSLENNYRAFAKQGLRSIGVVYYPGGPNLSAADAKNFAGLKRIVVLIGTTRARCEMTMVPIPEEQPPRGQVHEWNKTQYARLYAQVLREDMEKVAKKWKAYQRRRQKQGKSSPDWIVPTVEVAYLSPVCETVSPYSIP